MKKTYLTSALMLAAFSGSLIVAQFASLDDAQSWAEQDPYVDAGVYDEILIKPFKAVFK